MLIKYLLPPLSRLLCAWPALGIAGCLQHFFLATGYSRPSLHAFYFSIYYIFVFFLSFIASTFFIFTVTSSFVLYFSTAVYRTGHSGVEYACAVWSGGPTGCLQRLQDSFAKRHSLSLPPLEKRFEYHTLVLFYRVRANLAPTYLTSLVPPLTSTKSGYSFRKESYPCSPYKKICILKQLFAPCNYFLERPPSRDAVFKDVVNF